jgi:hypothetical protein
MIRKMFVKWSRTQELDVTAQLEAGIRYLDLRVCFFNGGSYFCHGLISTEVGKAMREVQTWAAAHPSEIIILDFNHTYGMTDVEHIALLDMLFTTFQNNLVHVHGEKGTSLTVGECWDQRRNVLILYEKRCLPKYNQEMWTSYAIRSKWLNKQRSPDMLVALDEELNFIKNTPPMPYRFWVFQGILTADNATCVGGATARFKPWKKNPVRGITDMAKLASPDTVKGLREKWHQDPINIVIIDMFHLQPDYVPTMIQLNASRPWAQINKPPTDAPPPTPAH